MLSRRICGLLPVFRNIRQIKISSIPLRTNSMFYFSTINAKVNSEKMEFKTQTKRLLDIVAKSLYTDSQVFIRELLSNASDALQKQRFKSQSSDGLMISIILSGQKQQVIIEDNGIGMSKQDLINNLGTIARSGSKQYVQKMAKQGKQIKQNIIGQFGVGFYSSFIVADHVEVISRVEGQKTHIWSSDGTGSFQIAQTDDGQLQRGTKVILHLKKDQQVFTQSTHFHHIIHKYSNFINFPISVNGQGINIVKAIWARDKKQIDEEQYKKFFQYLYGKTDYKYKMHFQSEVPLNIKSILFVPKHHSQSFTLNSQQKGQVSLYSKRVLIRKDCKDILFPSFLRFMKGVVDCQDIPLNISREHYQDSALMAKLRAFLTKKVLKHIKDQAKKDPEQYNVWYEQFNQFIKEGCLDPQFKKDVFELNRYEITQSEGLKTIEDYVKAKKPTQDKILYIFAPSRHMARQSPYVYPLLKAGIPVLVANTQIDEFIFKEIDVFEGLKFANVQTDHEDVERILKGVQEKEPKQQSTNEGIKDQDITGFSLWIKNQLQPYVEKVVVSKKNISGPALVISPISSSMRQMAIMRKMMQEKMKSGAPRADLRNLTFQFNPKDEMIVLLNEYRKGHPDEACMIVRQIFDNACLEAGIQSDGKSSVKRLNTMMKKFMASSKVQQTK